MTEFMKAALMRALWTFLQAAAGGIVAISTIEAFDWRATLITALVAAATSLTKSLLVGVPEIADVPIDGSITYDPTIELDGKTVAGVTINEGCDLRDKDTVTLAVRTVISQPKTEVI